MTDYLLDTNHVSALLDGHPVIQQHLQASPNIDRFGIAMPILGELYFRVYASQRQEQNMAELLRFLQHVEIWNYSQAEAEEFGRIQAEQKRKGRPIPAIDAQIAAVARVRELIVLTADRHFSFVDNLVIENWLKEGE